MPVNPSRDKSRTKAFELKSGNFTLPLLRLLSTDMDIMAEELAAKVQQAPEFFRNTPVVIDLSVLSGQKSILDFALLVGQLRGHGMIPIGVRGGNNAQNEAAYALELAILSEDSSKNAVSFKPSSQPEIDKKNQIKPRSIQASPHRTLLTTQPVRSGQRVYAPGGDLVILASVSSGAEIMADGHIHVYGALRGRALAGVKGNQDCQIFCMYLQAELISVAGHYRVSESLDAAIRSKPVHIYLENQTLKVVEI